MITKFRDKYNWCSNFFSVPIMYKGVLYQSVEAAYMSARCDDPVWKSYCADPMSSAGEIKRRSKMSVFCVDRATWQDEKLQVMEECLREKFKVPYLRELLLETGNQNIQEGNEWKDDFWGVRLDVQPNYGENHLGRLLMKIRDEIKLQKL